MDIIRIPKGKKFNYQKNGKVVCCEDYQRILKLCIPPNWKDVHISNNPISHLQVIGKDSKGRQQYIYHPMWIFLTSSDKYIRMGKFSRKIGLFEKKIKKDLFTANKIYSILFIILKNTHIRVGNECYAKENKTYGLVTLEKRHIKLKGSNIHLDFVGKKGVKQSLHFRDINCYNFFKNTLSSLKSDDRVFPNISGISVNRYLQETMGKEFTCKDFRTYASNILFLKYLCSLPEPNTQKEIKINLKNTYDKVAYKLGHTRAVSKNSYIMKLIPEQYIVNPKQFVNKPPRSIFSKLLRLN